MSKDELISSVKERLMLGTADYDDMIADILTMAADFCHLRDDYPDGIEVFVRRKIGELIAYQTSFGTGYVQHVKSISEGDGAISYADVKTRDELYELSAADKKKLYPYRRLG